MGSGMYINNIHGLRIGLFEPFGSEVSLVNLMGCVSLFQSLPDSIVKQAFTVCNYSLALFALRSCYFWQQYKLFHRLFQTHVKSAVPLF